MANIAIFRINYKSDFILTLNSDAGWMTPFCIKFWTGAPSQAFFVGWDGTTYTHCSYDPSEPTKLVVQFDDHHLPTGDLKFQIAYHFAMADFPNDTEDEVINPASITTEIDGRVYQVMLDFTGETAPEIEFSLPAYANEEQRIADEQTRIENEETRINQEQTRQDNEAQRIHNEQTRISQEEARVREFATLKRDAQEATTAANDAAALANQKAQLAADKAQLAADKAALAQDAATLANEKAQLATDKAALANDAAALANEKAALAQQKAEYAKDQGDYAKQQGDYAKEQGDYAKRKGDDAAAQMQQQAQAFSEAQAARQTAYEQAEGTESGSEAGDGSRWGTFKANEAARDAKVDAKVADITNLQKAVAEGAVYDISANHLTEGVPTKYADLTAALGTDGVNVPVDKRKGGMSIKYIQSSDNKYVQYRLMNATWSTNTEDWAITDEGVYIENPEFVYVKTDAEDKILWAIKADGDIYFGAGVPTQIKDYIQSKISELSLDEYEDIVAFLSDYLEGDATLKSIIDNLANTKVDKVKGKSLIDAEFAEGVSQVENPEFIEVHLDATGKILWAIKIDGSIYWGAGVPQQVIDYVTTKIQELSLDEYEDIVIFLGDFINGDKTLQQLLTGKVDKVTGKSLVNEDVANSMSFRNSDEYIQLLIDGEGKIIEAITSEGDKKIFVPIDTPAGKITYSESNEFYKTLLDSNKKIVFGIKRNGLVYSPLNIIKANKYIGRTLTFIGDSLSGGLVAGEYAIWAKGCKEELGLNVEGTQIGGTSICGTAATCYWQDSRINALSPNASIVIIEGGTNDMGSTIGDKTPTNYDTSTFWGGFNVMLSKIYYKYLDIENGYYSSIDYTNITKVTSPLYKIPIYVILPPQITLNEGDEHYPEWVNNIKIIRENLIELCELWGLDYIDANKIGYNRMTHNLSDAVHGAMEFYDVLSEKVVSKLIEYNV